MEKALRRATFALGFAEGACAAIMRAIRRKATWLDAWARRGARVRPSISLFPSTFIT